MTHAPQPHLDGIYTVFGHVLTGQDVVDRIEQGDRILRITVWKRRGTSKKRTPCVCCGRTLQFLGLVLTGVGFFQGVAGGNVRQELALLALGAAVFAGRLVQGARE